MPSTSLAKSKVGAFPDKNQPTESSFAENGNSKLILTLENGLLKKSDYEFTYINGNYERAKGLGWFVTGLFIVGDLAGGGLVALPTAMIRFGFVTGVACLTLMTFIACYTAYLLGQNWLILQHRWPRLYATGYCRKPYPEIALRAMGAAARNFISVCINMTQFGIAVVYLLLSSKNIHDFLSSFFSVNISFCVIVLFVAMALLPITFLKSPQDFWGVVVLAMFTTTLAVILILVGTALDYPSCSSYVSEPNFSFNNYFLALGTFVFSYGGHAVFPTIQHDMRKPHEFTKSSILAFAIIAILYIPVCVFAYITYGDSLRDSIINSLQSSWIQQSVNMLITIHCILTLTIVFNPINQEAEDRFHVPHHFCLKRVVVRTCTMLIIVFVAETVPSFGPLLDLVGASTLTLTSVILPALFYLYLKNGTEMEKESKLVISKGNGNTLDNFVISTKYKVEPIQKFPTISYIFKNTNRLTLFCCTFVIVFGVIGGFASSFSAIKEMSYANFVPPCYASVFLDSSKLSESISHTVCCGHYQNISRYASTSGDILKFCAVEDYSIYL